MGKLMKAQKFFLDPQYRFSFLSAKGFLNWMSDEAYIKKQFKLLMGYELDLKNPITFNEKLQWLKLNNQDNQNYAPLVDKYEVKKYVENILGEKYIIPTLGVWDSFDEIDFENLPSQFVLKCTHDSGGLVICENKEKLDIEQARKKINRSLKRNYYWFGREKPYKYIKPRIIAEKFMEDSVGSHELTDYKFYCFNGQVDCVLVCIDRAIHAPKFYFFDKDWNLKRYNIRGKEAPEDFTLPKPNDIDEMFEIAAKLAVNIPAVRIDLYQSNNHIYFGEFTFYPQSGYDANRLKEADIYFGNKIDLNKVNN